MRSPTAATACCASWKTSPPRTTSSTSCTTTSIRDWVHHLVGLRLNTFFDHDHRVRDRQRRSTHLRAAGQSPASIPRCLPRAPELRPRHRSAARPRRTRAATSTIRSPRSTRIDQSRASARHSAPADLHEPAGDRCRRGRRTAGARGPISGAQPPLIMTVKYLDGQLLSDIGVALRPAAPARARHPTRPRTTSISMSSPTAPERRSRALPGCRTSPAPASSAPCCPSWRSRSAASRC